MSADPYQLKDAMVDVQAALKPIESLASALRGLDTSHRQQSDIELIRLWYSEVDRLKVVGQLDAAKSAVEFSDEVMRLVVSRSSDQRTYEQYAEAHGKVQADMAFTSNEDAKALIKARRTDLDNLRKSHPVISRVHAQVRGW